LETIILLTTGVVMLFVLVMREDEKEFVDEVQHYLAAGCKTLGAASFVPSQYHPTSFDLMYNAFWHISLIKE
jgi:hypothetical protein